MREFYKWCFTLTPATSIKRGHSTGRARGITKNLGPPLLATNVSDHGARPWPQFLATTYFFLPHWRLFSSLTSWSAFLTNHADENLLSSRYFVTSLNAALDGADERRDSSAARRQRRE